MFTITGEYPFPRMLGPKPFRFQCSRLWYLHIFKGLNIPTPKLQRLKCSKIQNFQHELSNFVLGGARDKETYRAYIVWSAQDHNFTPGPVDMVLGIAHTASGTLGKHPIPATKFGISGQFGF